MATIANLNVNVGANTGRFDSGMAHLRKQLRGLGADANSAIAGITSGSLPRLGESLLALANPATAAVAALNAVAAAAKAAGGAAVGAAIAGIKLAADFEKAETSFTTLYKSAAVAKTVIAEIKQFAAETPFEFPELQAAGTKLAGFGVAASEIVPTMRMLGDLAAGVGANIGELAETYGKARVQGRAYTQDVNELANRGVPIWDALSKSQGASIAQIHAMVEAGQIGFPELQAALISLTSAGGQFEGGLDAQSKTLQGLYSTLHDNVNMALAEFGEILVNELDLKGALRNLIALTDTLPQYYAELREAVGVTRDAASAYYALDEAVGGPISQIVTFGKVLGAAREKLLDLQLAYARFTGNTELAGTIEGMRYDEAHPREKAKAKRDAPAVERGGDDAARDAAVALAGDAAKLTAELKEQAATYGMAAAEAKLWKLAMAGATAEQLAEARAAGDALEAVKASAKAAEEAAKAGKAQGLALEALDGDLRKQIETFGESTAAQRLWKFEQQYGTSAATEQTRALLDQLDALREQKKALDDSAAAAKKLKEEAASVVAETRTPAEKLAELKARLKEMRDAGLIDAETERRKLRGARPGTTPREAADERLAGMRDRLERERDALERAQIDRRTAAHIQPGRPHDWAPQEAAERRGLAERFAREKLRIEAYVPRDAAIARAQGPKNETPIALRGSAEAFSALNRGRAPDTAKQGRLAQLKEAQQQTRYLRRLERLAEDKREAVIANFG